MNIDGSFEELSGFCIEVDRDSADVVLRNNLNLSEYEVGKALSVMPRVLIGDCVYLVVGFDLADVAAKIIDFWNGRCHQKIELVVKHGIGLNHWYLLYGEMKITKVYYGWGMEDAG